MKTPHLLLLALVWNSAMPPAWGRPGSLDDSFDPGSGPDSIVHTSALQADGRIILGGDFNQVNGITRHNIARLSANGGLDLNFDPGSGANATVYSVVALADGRVLLGGLFDHVNEISRPGIARLSSNGGVDASFNPGMGFTGPFPYVNAIVVQADGRFLVGGSFENFNGIPRNNIARLNADGTLDTTFAPGSGANGAVTALAIQPDGKIVAAGSFTAINNATRNNIARFNANGSLDAGFLGNVNAPIYALALQSDGKVVIVGEFTSVDGISRPLLARLNANGALDPQFSANPDSGDSLMSVAVQPDGLILVGGSHFPNPNSLLPGAITRLRQDGTRDPVFNPGTGADGSIRSILLQPDGKIIVAGGFSSFDTVFRQGVARLNGVATLEDTYGHYLQLAQIEDTSDPNAFFFPFSTRLTIKNPTATDSAGGYVELTSDIPNQALRFPFQPVRGGGSITVDISASGTLPDECASGGIGTCTNKFYATIFEQVGTRALAEDSRFIFEVINTQPPSGGVPTGARSGTPAPGWHPPPTLTNLNIIGPAQVNAGSGADFAVLLQLSDGSSSQVSAATWNSSAFQISADGHLSTSPVGADTPVTISAVLTLGPVSKTASRQVLVLSGSTPRKNIGQPRRLANGDFQFVLSGLPARRYTLQTSLDLVLWTEWTTVTLDQSGEMLINDNLASRSSRRFYRARLLP